VPAREAVLAPQLVLEDLAVRAGPDLHEQVVVISASSANVPHVPLHERLSKDELGYDDDGILHLSARFGFADDPNLPQALRQAVDEGMLGAPVAALDVASYFLSRGAVRRTSQPGMARWRKSLFVTLAHNAADPTAYFGLPRDRTVTMGSDVDV